MNDAFVLLDDCNATDGLPTTRLYTEFVAQYVLTGSDELEAVWLEVEDAMRQGLQTVFVADYEWGTRLLNVGVRHRPSSETSCLRVMLFRSVQHMSSHCAGLWLADLEGLPDAAPAGISDLESSVSRAEYAQRIEEVLDYIRAGETYQINFTYRLMGKVFGDPVALYRRIRARQPVAFGALIRLPEASQTEWVLSCSPELFVEHTNGALKVRPMKGTVPRDEDCVLDQKNALWLFRDEKNRVENVMIVDLLRNDLGRISEIGSVKVPKLFTVESYRTVHQMTSTIVSNMIATTTFPDVLRALFPCGSITGAPKHHTMELIGRLESTPRGLYTGTIGWIESASDGRACGDFCMSVAIRTLTLGSECEGLRPAVLGIGGGIVADSTSESEFDETLVKARFLTGLDPGFTLFETFRAHRTSGIPGIDRHLGRLGSSARSLGFKFDADALKQDLLGRSSKLGEEIWHRMRVDLRHDGTWDCISSELKSLAREVNVVIAPTTLPACEIALLGHKTSIRATYDAGIRMAEAAGAFDAIFFNSMGQLTEGGRCSVFALLDGEWRTPPLSCGLLPGTMRARMLSWKGVFRERTITRDDLARVNQLIVCNALRGPLRAKVIDPASRAVRRSG